jgi:hypothetical protein
LNSNTPDKKAKQVTGQQPLFDFVNPDLSANSNTKKAAELKSNTEKLPARKFQVSNGHYLDFDHFARITHTLLTLDKKAPIRMNDLAEDSGLPFRQVRNRVSIARAMGLIEKNKLGLTEFGTLVAKYDPFCELVGTLEYLHFKASTNIENLIWYESFNSMFVENSSIDNPGWLSYFKNSLAALYTDKSLKDHLGKEVRFLIDAYLNQNFARLELLNQDIDEKFFIRRYSGLDPLVMSAILYDYANLQHTQLLQIVELTQLPGSPTIVFGLGPKTLRLEVEKLHDLGWLRYETTHNLDQIRLKKGFTALEFLSAYYEDRSPKERKDELPGEKKA